MKLSQTCFQSVTGVVSAERMWTLLLQGSHGWHKKSWVCSWGNKSRSTPGKRLGVVWSSPMYSLWLLSETRARTWQVLAGGQADQCLTQPRKYHTICTQTLPCQPGACVCHVEGTAEEQKSWDLLSCPYFLCKHQRWQWVTSASAGEEPEIPSSACVCFRAHKGEI